MRHQNPTSSMANPPPWPNQHTIPPPNFSVPPPNLRPGSFPRFSGPMHKQPTFQMNRMPPPGAINTSVPPPAINTSMPPPPLRGANNNQHRPPTPRFSSPSRGGFSQRPEYVNNRSPQNPNQRPPGFVSDDLFGDAPSDVPGGFPYFNPRQPPPVLPPNSSHQQQRGGGHRGRGGSGHGFRGGQNSHPHRGRGDFHGGRKHGGMNRGGGGGQFHNNGGRGGKMNGGGGQDTGPKKKQRIDKRDLPENNVFYCDICDRGFKNEEKYKEHTSNHQKCTYKDCPFVAAPKLVQLHISMQHRGGLAKRVWSVSSTEDIQKWKEERKKNYPTADNVRRKKELMEDRIARGEVIETKDFSKMSKGQGRHQGRGGPGRGHRDRGRGRGRGRFCRGGRFDYDRCDEDDQDAQPITITIDGNDDDDDGPPVESKIVKTRQDPTDDCHLVSDSSDEDFKEEGKIPPLEAKDTGSAAEPQQQKASKNANRSSLTLLSGYGSSASDSNISDDDDGDDDDNDNDGVGAGKKDAKKPFQAVDSGTESVSQTESGPGHSSDLTTPTPSLQERDAKDCLSKWWSVESSDEESSSPKCADVSPPVSDEVRSSGSFQSLSQHSKQQVVSSAASIVEDSVTEKDKIVNGNDGDSVNANSLNNLTAPPRSVAVVFPPQKEEGKGKKEECDSNVGVVKKDGAKPGQGKTTSPGVKGTKRGHGSQEGPPHKRPRHPPRPAQKSYTLLEKLLAKEIRRERNKILQCVHFIVKNKFFSDGSNSS